MMFIPNAVKGYVLEATNSVHGPYCFFLFFNHYDLTNSFYVLFELQRVMLIYPFLCFFLFGSQKRMIHLIQMETLLSSGML